MPIPRPEDARPDTSELLPLEDYDLIIVSFSGGKDCTACLLHLLDIGAPRDRIELWHQAVDGQPGKDERFFDWPCTESYCKAISEAFELPLLFQWKEGGFEGEMTRDARPTAPSGFETPEGQVITAGGKGSPGTRLKFPQVGADLSTRWCSAYLKIDVATMAINNDPRLKEPGTKVLIVTGERREESGNRSRYAEVDRHKSTNKSRRVDQWRPVLGWTEEEVWDAIRRYRVRPHPAYSLGWSRVSCMSCIFGNPDQWAAVREVSPDVFNKILRYENLFGKTIRRDGNVEQAANRGKSFVHPEHLDLAMTEEYPADIVIVPEGEKWEMPAGAFGHSGGPV